jgi:hypothetical protein
MIYIYADFNSCIKCLSDPIYECINLTSYGTLKSLNTQKIFLKEGSKYIFFEPQDIEVEGEVYFERKIPSIISNEGTWFAKIFKEEIKESKRVMDDFDIFPCFKCGFDMNIIFKEKGRQYNEICPMCNTPITYVLSNPGPSGIREFKVIANS